MFFLNTSKTYEPEIIINPNTRKIDIPEELYNIGVVADDNAEMVNIRIPRYFDGCDLSTRRCTISYNNALKERGVYTVNEIKIENDSLLLNWYISKFVTKKSGKIYFVVEFKKDMDERGRSYSWSTLPAELNVMAGLDDNIVIDESDLSLYRSLLSHIQATDRRVTGLIEQIGNITQPSVNLDLLNSQIADLQSNVDFIKESAAYIDGRQTVNEEVI